MANDKDKILHKIMVEVAYAKPDQQKIVSLQVQIGTTAYDAVVASRITLSFPEIDIESAAMGVFSKFLDGKSLPKPKDYQLKEKDRVEIYRPLLLDPKEIRRIRAAKAKQKRQASN